MNARGSEAVARAMADLIADMVQQGINGARGCGGTHDSAPFGQEPEYNFYLKRPPHDAILARRVEASALQPLPGGCGPSAKSEVPQ